MRLRHARSCITAFEGRGTPGRDGGNAARPRRLARASSGAGGAAARHAVEANQIAVLRREVQRVADDAARADDEPPARRA